MYNERARQTSNYQWNRYKKKKKKKNNYNENYKEKSLNDTVYEDYSEIETLKIENQLIKQLNNGLLDKNRILNSELLAKGKQAKALTLRLTQKLHLTQNQKAKECQS